MGGRKEEERNEKIIRGLLKLPPNRRCINCSSLGPQYVCTSFWTFICITCSGIHREFTHRVKSVSMSKFTSQEVEALQRGGNQRAREIFLNDWDMQHQRNPDSSNADKIREFIKSVYVDKKYAGGQCSDKPPRDTQNHKNNDKENRRASSYHSYSQSPPYEHQYEDRHYGKQAGILTRKPGSDRGHYDGKLSSFFYSPGRTVQQMNEDRFADEGSVPRFSDFSVSSAGDIQRSDPQSPNFQKETGYSSPPVQQVRNAIVEDVQRQTLGTYLEAETKGDVDKIPQSQRAASSSSVGSFDSYSVSLKSVNSGGEEFMTSSLPQPSNHMHSTSEDIFALSSVEPSVASSARSTDLFAPCNNPPMSATSPDQNSVTNPSSVNEGWATFDMPDCATSETKNASSMVRLPIDKAPKEAFDAFLFTNASLQGSTMHSSVDHKHFTFAADQWCVASHESNAFSSLSSSQAWNAFDDSIGNSNKSSLGSFSSNAKSQLPVHGPHDPVDSMMGFTLSEVSTANGSGGGTVGGVPVQSIPSVEGVSAAPFGLPVDSTNGGYIHESKSANPFDLPYESDLAPSNMFPDMSSLQAALPSSQFPNPFASDKGEPWFSQDHVPSYISSIPYGGLAYMAAQPAGSQLPLPAQGPVASVGNPFA